MRSPACQRYKNGPSSLACASSPERRWQMGKSQLRRLHALASIQEPVGELAVELDVGAICVNVASYIPEQITC